MKKVYGALICSYEIYISKIKTKDPLIQIYISKIKTKDPLITATTLTVDDAIEECSN